MLIVIGCVPDITTPDTAMPLYGELERACGDLDGDSIDPFSSIQWTDARPIRVMEGKARLQRTAGVWLAARTATHADAIEQAARCRMLLLASDRAVPSEGELLAVDGGRVAARRRGEFLLVQLTAPTRTGGAALLERARLLVRRRDQSEWTTTPRTLLNATSDG